MNSIQTLDLILFKVGEYGTAILTIITAVISIGLAYLVFRTGWRMMKDQSFQMGGYYLRQTPYKGYNRWRSKAWNSTHMPVPPTQDFNKNYKAYADF